MALETPFWQCLKSFEELPENTSAKTYGGDVKPQATEPP